MLTWEGHRDLSESIGDSVNATASSIPDGARWSAAKRDDYLYRGMLMCIKEVTEQVAALPRRIANVFVKNNFTTLITEYTFDLGLSALAMVGNNGKRYTVGIPHPAYIISLWYNYPYTPVRYPPDDYGESFPIPLRQGTQVEERLNSRVVHIPDAFCEYIYDVTPNLYIYDFKDELKTSGNLYLEYLPLPTHPDYTKPTDELTLEPLMFQKVISWATFFAMADSQDLQNLDRYLTLTLLGARANAGQST